MEESIRVDFISKQSEDLDVTRIVNTVQTTFLLKFIL